MTTTRRQRKDFSGINPGRVYDTIATATAEPEEVIDMDEMDPAQDTQEESATQEEHETHNERKERRTYNEEEALQMMQALKTAGRKGVKLPRINVAFAPQTYDYITTMSRVRGETMTAFVNKIILEHMQEHRELYDKALEFRNSF